MNSLECMDYMKYPIGKQKNIYLEKKEQNQKKSYVIGEFLLMNREQEDILLEDYIDSLREESNLNVSFVEYKDREIKRIKNFKHTDEK